MRLVVLSPVGVRAVEQLPSGRQAVTNQDLTDGYAEAKQVDCLST